MFDFHEHAHTRLNILTGEWILVSPHRMKRPWQGKVEALAPDNRPEYDPTCYLCPGNHRADGLVNPAYEGSYAFVNDFSVSLADALEYVYKVNNLFLCSSLLLSTFLIRIC